MKLFPLLVALGLLMLVPGAESAEEKYEVRISRPVQQGDHFTLTAKVAVEVSAAVTLEGQNDPVPVRRESAARITGELKILAVTKAGDACEAELTLKEAEVLIQGKKAELLQAGDVIRARDQGLGTSDEMTVNGKAMEPEVVRLMAYVMPMAADHQVSDSAVIDPSGRVKLGEEWTVNREALLQLATQQKMKGLNRESFSGTARLTDTATLAEQPALNVEYRVKVNAREVVGPAFPDGADAYEDDQQFIVSRPVDLASAAYRQQVKRTLKMSGLKITVGGDRPALEDMTIRYVRDVTVLPVR